MSDVIASCLACLDVLDIQGWYDRSVYHIVRYDLGVWEGGSTLLCQPLTAGVMLPQQVSQMPTECKQCGKQVFQMERIVAERAAWHKNCFRCTECNTILT